MSGLGKNIAKKVGKGGDRGHVTCDRSPVWGIFLNLKIISLVSPKKNMGRKKIKDSFRNMVLFLKLNSIFWASIRTNDSTIIGLLSIEAKLMTCLPQSWLWSHNPNLPSWWPTGALLLTSWSGDRVSFVYSFPRAGGPGGPGLEYASLCARIVSCGKL